MVDFVDYWSYLPNILEDIKALSKHRKSESYTGTKVVQRPRSASSNVQVHTVRNSVCVAGIDRESVLTVKKQVHRLISGRCALESFHFRDSDDIKDGALFVPKVILVAVFQPGRKLIDDDGDGGQLDEAYDEIFENGAELMLIYLDLPKLVYPINTRNLYHVRLEQLVFPEQTTVKNLAGHGLLLTLTENSRKLNQVQEQRLLEWLLRPVDPRTHPVFQTCALFNALQQRKDHEGIQQLRTSLADFSFQRGYQVDQGSSSEKEGLQFKFSRATHSSPERGWSSSFTRPNKPGSSSQLPQRTPRFSSSSEDDDDGDEEQQMKRHGFMASMESYPLLQRNSRGKNRNKSKKQDGPRNKSSKNIGARSKSNKNDDASPGSFHHYGTLANKGAQAFRNPFLL